MNKFVEIQLIWLATLFGFCMLVDGFDPLFVDWWFYGVIVVLALCGSLPALFVASWRRSLLFFGVFVLALLVLSQVGLNPEKQFMRFYRSVKPGMNVGEVDQLFAACFPKNGRFRVPLVNSHTKTDMHYVLDPDNGDYDAETITIDLKEGHVTGKSYLRD